MSGSRWTISEPLNSSLSYLRRAVTGLGKSLGIVTTAEGVKIDTQFELLRREGCTQAQGYLFSQPRPVAEVNAMLSRPRARIVA